MYITRGNDTCSNVARRLGMDENELVKLNRLLWPSLKRKSKFKENTVLKLPWNPSGTNSVSPHSRFVVERPKKQPSVPTMAEAAEEPDRLQKKSPLSLTERRDVDFAWLLDELLHEEVQNCFVPFTNKRRTIDGKINGRVLHLGMRNVRTGAVLAEPNPRLIILYTQLAAIALSPDFPTFLKFAKSGRYDVYVQVIHNGAGDKPHIDDGHRNVPGAPIVFGCFVHSKDSAKSPHDHIGGGLTFWDEDDEQHYVEPNSGFHSFDGTEFTHMGERILDSYQKRYHRFAVQIYLGSRPKGGGAAPQKQPKPPKHTLCDRQQNVDTSSMSRKRTPTDVFEAGPSKRGLPLEETIFQAARGRDDGNEREWKMAKMAPLYS